MKIDYAIKSYKRAGQVKTLEIMPYAKIWIPESQLKDYLKYYSKSQLRTVPDDEDGNACKKANAILDRTKYVIIVDDDISSIGYWENGYHYKLEADDLKRFIERGFDLAKQLGVRMWGVNVKKDEIGYTTYKPISFLSPLLAPFCGYLDTDIRNDLSLPTKHDYDFWLQNIKKYRKTLRFNKYHYTHKHGIAEGGLAGVRTMKMEKQSAQTLLNKWGSKVIKIGGSKVWNGRDERNILNTRVSVPINGA